MSNNQMHASVYSMFEQEVSRGTNMSAGIDVRAPYDIMVDYTGKTVVDTGIIFKLLPDDTNKRYVTYLVPRSSAGIKKGITLQNTVGVIDQDYCGKKDFIKAAIKVDLPWYERVIMFLTRRKKKILDKSERFCQLLVHEVETPKLLMRYTPPDTESRGGIGSTNTK